MFFHGPVYFPLLYIISIFVTMLHIHAVPKISLSEVVVIEPRTAVTFALAVSRSNHFAR
jgi:hypothetical protein